MAKKEESEKKGGCLSRLLGLLTMMVLCGIGASIFFLSKPQDLSDIGGVGKAASTAVSPPRNLKTVLEKSIEGGYAVTISEKEINEMFVRELRLEQEGKLAEWVSIKQVLVRLKEGMAEVVVVRDVAGYPFTTSIFLQVEQVESQEGIANQISRHGGEFHELINVPKRGGRFGRLTVPQGFLILVMPEFTRIAEVFDEEIKLGFQRMAQVKIQNKRLMFDPNAPTGDGDPGIMNF